MKKIEKQHLVGFIWLCMFFWNARPFKQLWLCILTLTIIALLSFIEATKFIDS